MKSAVCAAATVTSGCLRGEQSRVIGNGDVSAYRGLEDFTLLKVATPWLAAVNVVRRRQSGRRAVELDASVIVPV